MTLSEATLFPQALFPLFIFEPRYRRMLADTLETNRFFCVAMQKPTCTRESPERIAGLGIIRVSVQHPDDTSHLILQGIVRVELLKTVRYRPYRLHRIRPIETPRYDAGSVATLMKDVKKILLMRMASGEMTSACCCGNLLDESPIPSGPAYEILQSAGQICDPEHLTDLISCAAVGDPGQRQSLLATIRLEERLELLRHYLSCKCGAGNDPAN